MLDVMLCFFFFQAEDGIRDIGVTGVQTCALPIFSSPYVIHPIGRATPSQQAVADSPVVRRRAPERHTWGQGRDMERARSEERRVGKECRSRWSPDPLKKKKRRQRRSRDGKTMKIV